MSTRNWFREFTKAAYLELHFQRARKFQDDFRGCPDDVPNRQLFAVHFLAAITWKACEDGDPWLGIIENIIGRERMDFEVQLE